MQSVDGEIDDARVDDATTDASADVVLLGVGRASPREVTALAKALALPIELVVDAVYRAPARLLANVPAADATRLVEIVRSLGLDATTTRAGRVPTRGPVFDIAGDLLDAAQADVTASALGTFLGVTPAAALDALLTPPGILLGNVSATTRDALERVLPRGAVALTAAEPNSSGYALFAAGLTPLQQGAVRSHLPEGTVIARDGSVTLFDLSRERADAIWRRLKAPEQVRIVNQAFLRFTILLAAVPENAERGAEALEVLASVPRDDYAMLATVLPVPVEVRVPFVEVSTRLAAYADAGFGARAELETFATVALDVHAATADALASAGLAGIPPFRTVPMPEPRARLMRARLEAAGADVVEAL